MDTIGSASSPQGPSGSVRPALPFTDQAPAATHAPRAPRAASIPPRRILCIDDDPMVRRTLAGLLRMYGHTVEEADDGSAGLAILGQRPVDLVLTDLGMPGLNGWEVARAAKSQNPQLPVVLVTGWANTIATENPARIFVDAILPKPCRIEEIQATIGRLTEEAAWPVGLESDSR
jgi:CheY-like chemotaxis protein